MPIRVKISGVKNFIKSQRREIKQLSQRHTEEMARETKEVMREEIRNSIKRVNSTGNLEENINDEPISNGHGVGNIEQLNKNAPYWKWQNDGVAGTGRRIPPPSTGQFNPGNPAPITGESGSRWEKPGAYLIRPKKAIEAKLFVEKTVAKINIIVNSVLRRIR